MSRRRRNGLAREIARRQKHHARQMPAVPVRTPQQLREALAPRPAWCDWQGWGYLMPERDGIDTPTGYLPVIDYVRDHSFGELRGQVAR